MTWKGKVFMAIQINTDAVLTTAEQIDTINRTIQEDLSDIDRLVRNLQNAWSGDASRECVEKYNHIKRDFSDARFSAVNNMVSFMRNQVAQGYEDTEKSAKSAAEAFK